MGGGAKMTSKKVTVSKQGASVDADDSRGRKWVYYCLPHAGIRSENMNVEPASLHTHIQTPGSEEGRGMEGGGG